MRDQLIPLLAEAREEHDILVVFVHWGDEYAERPDVYTQKVSRALIDEGGADLVVGHHPHVLQAVERHGKGLIAYSMGNFLFENTNAIPRLTGVLRVAFTGEEPCLSKAIFHVAHITRKPSKHPVPSDGYLAKTVRSRVIKQGAEMGTEWVEIEGSEDLELPGLSCE
jgi:poly-gamma-glutamate synthesis protein (capsule biosynthesis protein)